MLSSIGRAAISRVVSTASVTSSRRITVSWLAANHLRPGRSSVRCFAAPARAKTSATAARATKPTATKERTKSTKATKSKTASKKTTKAKSKSKPKPKPKKTGRKRKALSPERKALLERRELKKKALFSEPKNLPDTEWTVFFGDWIKQTTGSHDDMKTKLKGISEAFKNLSTSESQRLASVAEQNKLSNNAAYKAWVESHTPLQIKEAIRARRLLKEKYNFPPKKTAKTIQDERIPKHPVAAFMLFSKARWASGEFANTTAPEAAKQIGSEWKNLPDTERQSYQDLAKAASDQYAKEMGSILHRPVRKASSKQ
ncbi:hypothetical protein F5Y04DRAFT_249830 [Hypomontagnella monticulosa]|nr:hypothetical protein F5Y04DRAFT_249830 [Hypomontagnella monticulosa]